MPTSPARSSAARANGAKSRGPQTPEGKLASSRNAFTHGLTARTVVLDHESQDDYQAELRAYLDHFRPQSKPEIDLVHQLSAQAVRVRCARLIKVAAQWRLSRYAAIETAILDRKMADQADWVDNKYEEISGHHRLAIAFESLAGANGSLALLNRYQARLHREYQRILKTLADFEAARRARPAKSGPQQKLPNEPKPAPQLSLDPEREQGIAWGAQYRNDDSQTRQESSMGQPALKAAVT